MIFTTHSYRFAQEIIEHPKYVVGYREIISVIEQCPLFIYPNKSQNRRLDIVQQLLNSFFDRKFACDLGWELHPDSTRIPDSGLAADYRKEFNGLRIQSEVQFGNMSRWYSDIFKFQTAYSQDLIDMGLSIVPVSSIARRIDSNVVNFERCVRELPSAKLSITLPILLIGVDIDISTTTLDASTANFTDIKAITGKGNSANKFKIINGFLTGTPISDINIGSPTGPMPNLEISDEEES